MESITIGFLCGIATGAASMYLFLLGGRTRWKQRYEEELRKHAETVETYEILHRVWATNLEPMGLGLMTDGKKVLSFEPNCSKDKEWPEILEEKIWRIRKMFIGR